MSGSSQSAACVIQSASASEFFWVQYCFDKPPRVSAGSVHAATDRLPVRILLVCLGIHGLSREPSRSEQQSYLNTHPNWGCSTSCRY